MIYLDQQKKKGKGKFLSSSSVDLPERGEEIFSERQERSATTDVKMIANGKGEASFVMIGTSRQTASVEQYVSAPRHLFISFSFLSLCHLLTSMRSG